MDYPSYIIEAVEIVRFGLDTTRSVDGFIIKLESAITHILRYGSDNDVKIFFDLLVDKGLLNKLACHKDDIQTVLSSPRHSLMRRYSEILHDALDKSICIGGYQYVIPPPSRSAGQISWSEEYRDVSKVTIRTKIFSISRGQSLLHLLATVTLIIILLLLLYSAYNAYTLLQAIFVPYNVINPSLIFHYLGGISSFFPYICKP
jgi:hypothetical protein